MKNRGRTKAGGIDTDARLRERVEVLEGGDAEAVRALACGDGIVDDRCDASAFQSIPGAGVRHPGAAEADNRHLKQILVHDKLSLEGQGAWENPPDSANTVNRTIHLDFWYRQ